MSEDRLVRVEQIGRLVKVVLQRAPLNVLNIAMLRELDDLLSDPGLIESVNALVLCSEEKAFSAGVDVADHTPERTAEMLQVFHSAIVRLWELPLPTVALVTGAALGGGAELAAACDIILASERAKFGQPEILLGVFPPVAMAVLPAAVGSRRAAELILTGRTVGAAEALNLGWINQVFSNEEFSDRSAEYLQQLERLSRCALVETKAGLREVQGASSPAAALKTAEERYLSKLMATSDAQEGIQAFMERRRPVWRHC